MTISPYSDLLSLWLQELPFNHAISYKSPAHSSTGTRSVFLNLPLLVRLEFHILFHYPLLISRRRLAEFLFHLSLTVLLHYRSPSSIKPYEVVLADSHGISRVPCYSGFKKRKNIFFANKEKKITGLSPSMVQVSSYSFLLLDF